MIKFLITGYYGFLNSGDDAILMSMCEDIKALDLNTKITILSNSPNATKVEYSENAVYRFNMYYVIREIMKCDVLLMGGGSLLQDKTSTRSIMYYLSILLTSKLFGKKCMIYANGIGPIRKPFNRKVTKFILNKIDLITVRESLSFEELKILGVTKPKIKITADPVFSLTTKSVNIDHINLKKPFVTVLFRKWDNQSVYINTMAKVCDYLVEEKNMNVVFVPMKYPSDIKVSEEISKRMKNESYIITKKLNVSEIIEITGQAKINLSMRLHALLYSAIKTVPMIGFTYDPKVENFLKELKVSSMDNINNFTEEQVINIINEILENYDEVKSLINNQTNTLIEKANLNEKYLKELCVSKKGELNEY